MRKSGVLRREIINDPKRGEKSFIKKYNLLSLIILITHL